MLNFPDPKASAASGLPSGPVMQTKMFLVPDCATLFTSISNVMRSLSTLFAVAVVFSLPLFVSSMPSIEKLEACRVVAISIISSFSLIIMVAEA